MFSVSPVLASEGQSREAGRGLWHGEVPPGHAFPLKNENPGKTVKVNHAGILAPHQCWRMGGRLSKSASRVPAPRGTPCGRPPALWDTGYRQRGHAPARGRRGEHQPQSAVAVPGGLPAAQGISVSEGAAGLTPAGSPPRGCALGPEVPPSKFSRSGSRRDQAGPRAGQRARDALRAPFGPFLPTKVILPV